MNPFGFFILGCLFTALAAWLLTAHVRCDLERAERRAAYFHTLYTRLLTAVRKGDAKAPDWEWGQKGGRD